MKPRKSIAMRTLSILVTCLVGIVLITPIADARGFRGGGGGRGGAKMSHSRPSIQKRSPMTGSRISRPARRPAPKPVARPARKPESRPSINRPKLSEVKRPSVNRPERPSISKPQAERPGIPDRPKISRPDIKRPARPDIGKPDASRPSRPDARPGIADGRPELNRPSKGRPATLPGMVSYPNRPGKDKPGLGSGGGNRPSLGSGNRDRPNIGKGNGNKLGNNIGKGSGDRLGNNIGKGNGNNIGNRIGNGDRTKLNIRGRDGDVNINRVNVNKRNNGLVRPSLVGDRKRDWDNKRWGGRNSVWGNGINIGNDINIDANFRHNNNFSLRPNYWGGRPWWGAGHYHGWHHGHWNYGWNNHYHHRWYYDDNDFADGFMWGIAAWSFGAMIYDMGYHTYSNPYPAPVVIYNNSDGSDSGDSKSGIDYSQPLAVAAAEIPAGDDAQADLAETRSDEALEESRQAFKSGDYVKAMSTVDVALGYTPGDVTIHEYRALVLFALGKYSQAAGVLNPVLASGPGWGWETMVGFYPSTDTYNDQLRELEAYIKGKPDSADARFLLGYHYMVCDHMPQAYDQFEAVTKLQPADSVSRQLRDLTKDSLPAADDQDDIAPEVAPDPVPVEELVGTWTTDQGKGKITFNMEESGDFLWSFNDGKDTTELKGTYGLDDKGLLVLTTDDSQMVSVVSLEGGKTMDFTLVGAPDGEAGLVFTKG